MSNFVHLSQTIKNKAKISTRKLIDSPRKQVLKAKPQPILRKQSKVFLPRITMSRAELFPEKNVQDNRMVTLLDTSELTQKGKERKSNLKKLKSQLIRNNGPNYQLKKSNSEKNLSIQNIRNIGNLDKTNDEKKKKKKKLLFGHKRVKTPPERSSLTEVTPGFHPIDLQSIQKVTFNFDDPQEVKEIAEITEISVDPLKEFTDLTFEMAKENKALLKEIEQLQNQVMTYEQNEAITQELEKIIDDLENEKKKVHDKCSEFQKQLEKVTENYQESIERLGESQKELEEYNKLKRKHERLLKKAKEYKREMKRLASKNMQVSELEEREHSLLQQISNLEFDKKTLLEKNSQLITEITATRTHLQNLKKKFMLSNTHVIQYNQFEKENVELKIQNTWLEKLTFSKAKMDDALETIINIHFAEISDQKQEEKKILGDAQQALDFVANKLPELFTSQSDDQEDLTWYQIGEHISKHELQLLTIDDDSKRKLYYMACLIELSKMYFDLQQKILDFQANEKIMKEELIDVQKQLVKVNKINEELEEKMQNKLQENEKEQQMKFVVLRNQVERIKNKEKALKRQLESSETQIKQLNEVMAEKERILQQEQQMREAYSNSNRELKEKLLTIQEETESKISSLTLNYEQKITQNMNEINELKNEKNLAIEEKEQQHKIEMEDFKFKMRTQSQQLIETQEKILFLETQLTREQNENEEITKKLTEKMEEEKEKDQQKLEQALEIFEETKKSLIKEQKLREKLESEQKQLQEKLEMMSAEIYSEKQERETMEEEKTKLSSITTSLSAENVTLKKKLEHIIALDHAFSPREISNTSFEHEIDLLEMSMIRYINHTFKYDRHLVHILPIGTKTPSLAGAILDGVLLCKLINHAVPGTLDERALTIISPTEEQIVENHTLCLNSAQSIGCDVFAITVDDLVSGVDNVVIALAWEITIAGLLSTISLEKHPEILCLFSENEKMQSIKDMPPEKLLMRWVNYHLKQANSSRVIKNFAEDLRDSECLLILLNQLSPKRCPLDEYSEDMDYESRAELVVSNAAKLNCPFFVSVSNIVSADYSELNIAFLAKLFHTRSGLKVSSEDINLRILDYTALGTREERAFRIWINTFGFEPRVTALYKDLRNGIVVLKILDKIKPGFVDWKHVNTDFSNIYQEIENCNYAIEVGKKLGLRLVNISGTDIFNGSQTLLLGFLWQTMEFHLKNILSELKVIKSGKITDTEMVEWANAQIKSAGKSSQVSSLKDPSIKSGLFFVDLVFAIKSSFVNYDFVQLGDSSQEYMNNALYAITLCRKLGANIFVIPEDIVEVKPKMLLTIIGELMRIHKQLN